MKYNYVNFFSFLFLNLYQKFNPFISGNANQFSTDDVYRTQEIAQLRIHVERSIGRVKNFHVLEGVVPLSIVPLINKIFQVCCWLTNLDLPLVDGKKPTSEDS